MSFTTLMSSNGEKYMERCRLFHLLPCAEQLDTYGDAALMGLRESFHRLISSSTYLAHSRHFAHNLGCYISLFGLRFTKEECVAILKFGISLVFCGYTDSETKNAWWGFILDLLRSADPFISREEMQLDWKLFRNATLFVGPANDVREVTAHSQTEQSITAILKYVTRFFPVACVEEIWNYYKADIFDDLRKGQCKDLLKKVKLYMPFYSWTFDEIRRVMLDDLFYILYKFSNEDATKEVLSFLGRLVVKNPGMIDWEPHLDRIFNFLLLKFVSDNTFSKIDLSFLEDCPRIIIDSIRPNSSTMDRLRKFFEVCKCVFHPSTEHNSSFYFVIFCYQLLTSLNYRITHDLNDCPEMANVFGRLTDWAKVTREQVDEFVDILLPICFEGNMYMTKSFTTSLMSIKILAALRPRLILPRLLETLETSFLSPELSLRVTRSLMALTCASSQLTVYRAIPNYHIDFISLGAQPSDQIHNYPTPQPTVSRTAEEKKYLNSHLSAMIYPEGRTLVPRIIRSCLECLNMNNRDRLLYSIMTLSALFMTMPMQDFSNAVTSPAKEGMVTEEKGQLYVMQQTFTASKVAKASAGVEDLVIEVYSRVLSLLQGENDTALNCVEVSETEHKGEASQGITPFLAGLGVHIALSASPVPRLRVRLVKLLLNSIFQNLWNYGATSYLSAMLFWLISGRRAVSQREYSSDIEIFTLNEFWPRFRHLFEELNNKNIITKSAKVESQFLTLLGILPAILCALLPSHLTAVKTDFVDPLIDILSRLLTVSLGDDGECSPSNELAQAASHCAGVLVSRLSSFSLNFDHLDVFNSLAHRPSTESAFLNDPLWTPYVNWRELIGKCYWNSPTNESFAVAERVVRMLYLPALLKLSDSTKELRTYIGEEMEAKGGGFLQLVHSSQQSSTSLQQIYLISLSTWIGNMFSTMSEALKPRFINLADDEYVKKVCTELEISRENVLNTPQSSTAAADARLRIPFFDVVTENGIGLREKTFRAGLEFLDVLAKLSAKYDVLNTSASARLGSHCVIGSLYNKESLECIARTTLAAGGNFVLMNEMSGLHMRLLGMNISCHNAGISNMDLPMAAKITRFFFMFGASRELLTAYAKGESPSLLCDGGGRFGIGFLPLAWLFKASILYNGFVNSSLQCETVWPSCGTVSIFFHRLPVDAQLLHLVEVCVRIGLSSNKDGVWKVALRVFFLDTDLYMPGAITLVVDLIVDALNHLCDCDLLRSEDSIYRTWACRRKRAVSFLKEMIENDYVFSMIRSNNPLLWAELWIAFAKSALFRKISPSSSINSITAAQCKERYRDQEEICRIFGKLFKELSSRHFPLFFPTYFEAEAYPKNSPLRNVIVDAIELLRIMGGSKMEVVMKDPPLLVNILRLRRRAYRNLTQALFTECVDHRPYERANEATVTNIIWYYPFMSSTLWNMDGSEEFKVFAPPSPPPQAALVRRVLVELAARSSNLAKASVIFIYMYLSYFLLRSRGYLYVNVDPNAEGLSVSRSDHRFEQAGLMLEPCFNCLSSEENFTLPNLVNNLHQPFLYLGSPKVWVNPLYSPDYPHFHGSGMLKTVGDDGSTDSWLKSHPEMDFSLYTLEDMKELHDGLTAAATHFASSAFWSHLSHALLHYHRCRNEQYIFYVRVLIRVVLESFGPRPFLQRVEDFFMLLINPTLLNKMDGVVEFVGPTLANELLCGLVEGSAFWPREAQLTVFTRVVPRLIVAIEAALMLASAQPFDPDCEALVGVRFVNNCDNSCAKGEPCSTSAENDDTSVNDDRAYKILSETWNCGFGTEEASKKSKHYVDLAGSKPRLPVCIFTFVMKYLRQFYQPFNHLPYIWRFLCELASDAMDEREIPSELVVKSEVSPQVQVCGHRMTPGSGECPVCFGRRLLPCSEHRRAMMFFFCEALLINKEWDVLYLLKHFVARGAIEWETLVCNVSKLIRNNACCAAEYLAASSFNAILTETPPSLRFYSDACDCNSVQVSDHVVTSCVETKLIAPLVASGEPTLFNNAVVGPEFVTRRFLPLLVRDLLAVTVFKGIVPSGESFALQSDLLASAVEELTPATKDLINCSSKTKRLVSQQLNARLAAMFERLPEVLNNAFPANPSSNSQSGQTTFLRIAPLLADFMSSSDFFWNPNSKNFEDDLTTRVSDTFLFFYKQITPGHTNAELSLAHARCIMDIEEVFVLHNSWKIRISGLRLIRMLMICNISTIWRCEELRLRLKRLLCGALSDPRVEVARDACDSIARSLQLGILKYDEEWFRSLVKASRWPQEKGISESEPSLLQRHAAVLGLCAFVKAHVHDTPDYLPAVIATLADHAHDPQPIAKSVADTLMDYSRTHHGQWFEDQNKFSETQLEAYLSVVSSVSYYV